jgi:hypothetical protein
MEYLVLSMLRGGRKNEPLNPKLYDRIKRQIKRDFTPKGRWSAYKSFNLQRIYKKKGGKYKGKKNKSSNLSVWAREKWKNVCTTPYKPCGRKSGSKAKFGYRYCRPTVRVNKRTPTLASELTREQIKRRCKAKKKNPAKHVSRVKRKRSLKKPPAKHVSRVKRKRSLKKKSVRTKCNVVRPSTRPEKKFMVLACANGKQKTIHFGAKGYGHNYSKKARDSYRKRHHCAEEKNKLTANWWSCNYSWNPNSSEKKECPSNRRCKK